MDCSWNIQKKLRFRSRPPLFKGIVQRFESFFYLVPGSQTRRSIINISLIGLLNINVQQKDQKERAWLRMMKPPPVFLTLISYILLV